MQWGWHELVLGVLLLVGALTVSAVMVKVDKHYRASQVPLMPNRLPNPWPGGVNW
jgi:hypothetical protein